MKTDSISIYFEKKGYNIIMHNVENGDFYETKLEFGNLDLRQKVNYIAFFE